MATHNSGTPKVEYKPGDTAYLIESNRFVREGCVVRKCGGGMYIFGFPEGGGIRVSGSRIYPTLEAAKKAIGLREPKKIRKSTMYIPDD